MRRLILVPLVLSYQICDTGSLVFGVFFLDDARASSEFFRCSELLKLDAWRLKWSSSSLYNSVFTGC